VVTAIRDGLVSSDVGAQTFDSNLQLNWDVDTFGVDIYRADVYVYSLERGQLVRLGSTDGPSSPPMWTSVLTSNTSYGFSNLSLVKGRTYGSCLRCGDFPPPPAAAARGSLAMKWLLL
jgi:hypothetical protein